MVKRGAAKIPVENEAELQPEAQDRGGRKESG
jgi:hypothetical protein